jgi:hypothetical protein
MEVAKARVFQERLLDEAIQRGVAPREKVRESIDRSQGRPCGDSWDGHGGFRNLC